MRHLKTNDTDDLQPVSGPGKLSKTPNIDVGEAVLSDVYDAVDISIQATIDNVIAGMGLDSDLDAPAGYASKAARVTIRSAARNVPQREQVSPPEPVRKPEPKYRPKPIRKPEPAPKPETIPTPTPTPIRKPETIPTPTTIPKPIPTPEPVSEPIVEVDASAETTPDKHNAPQKALHRTPGQSVRFIGFLVLLFLFDVLIIGLLMHLGIIDVSWLSGG